MKKILQQVYEGFFHYVSPYRLEMAIQILCEINETTLKFPWRLPKLVT